MASETCCVHMRALSATLLPSLGSCLSAVAVRKFQEPWYTGLQKPKHTLPDCCSGHIKTLVYSGIGFASYLVYKEGNGCQGPAKVPLILYGTHLALNLSWQPTYLYLKNLDFGCCAISLVTATGVLVAHAFYKIEKKAGYLFAPYLLYLCYNTCHMFSLRKLNKKAVQ